MKNNQTNSALARLLYTQGLTVEQIADQLNVRPSAIIKALERNPRPGRPGGGLHIESQIKWARRIAQSAYSSGTKALAECLLHALDEDARLEKSGRRGGA